MGIKLDSNSYNHISTDYNKLKVLSRKSVWAASIKQKICFF